MGKACETKIVTGGFHVSLNVYFSVNSAPPRGAFILTIQRMVIARRTALTMRLLSCSEARRKHHSWCCDSFHPCQVQYKRGDEHDPSEGTHLVLCETAALETASSARTNNILPFPPAGPSPHKCFNSTMRILCTQHIILPSQSKQRINMNDSSSKHF